MIVNEALIDTGDLLVTRRWTGRPTVGMLVSGSLATNVAMVIKTNEGAWVIES